MADLMKSFAMEFGLIVNEEGRIITDSIKVANFYGKDHSDVLKKIRKFIDLIPELGQGFFAESSYVNEQNKKQPFYIMDKKGFSMLVNKFTGDDATIFTYKYTKAFEEMEKEIENLKKEIKDISQIAISDDTQSKRILELNKLNFSERMTQKSFKNCVDYKQYEDMLSRFLEYIKPMSAEQRVLKMEHAIKGMEILRRNLLLDNMANVGNTINIDNDIKNMLKMIDKINNKSLGGEKAAKTKKIQHLEIEKEMLESQLQNGFNPFA